MIFNTISYKLFNNYNVLAILFFSLVVFDLQAQEDIQKIQDKADLLFDSLLTELQDTQVDTVKINILNEISWNYVPTNFAKSIKFADSALALSRSINWLKGEAYSLKNKGEALRYKGDIKNALLTHETALSIFKRINDQQGVASLMSNIGIAHYMLSDFPKAYEYYSKALSIFQERNQNKEILNNLTLIGVLFYSFDRMEKALEYYNSALDLAQKIGNEIEIATQYANIGLVLLGQEKYEDSIIKLKEALNLYRKNHDIYNYTKMCGNVGLAYSKILKFEQANKYFEYALQQSININDNRGIAFQYSNIGELKFDQYKNQNLGYNSLVGSSLLNESEKYLLLSINKYKSLGLLEYQKNLSKKLAEVYKHKRQFEQAYEYMDLFTNLQDSLFSSKINKRLAEFEVEQSLSLKEKEIELLNKDYEYERLLKQIFIGLALILVVLSVYVFNSYKNKVVQNRLLEENIQDRKKAEESLKKNEVELNRHKNNLEQLVKKRTIELEEEIQERIHTESDLLDAIERVEAANRAKTVFLENMSHELRTPLVGILGYSSLLANEVDTSELKEMAEGINRTGNRLLNTLSMILDLARVESDKFEINITEIDVKKELTEIYQNFKGAVSLKNIDFVIEFEEIETLYSDIGLFKVVVENLVNNAIKFTKEGKISIHAKTEIENGNKCLSVSVEDTGIGIKKNEIPMIFKEFKQLSEGTLKDFQGTGLGLSISKKFLEYLNGKLDVESQIGIGSKFTIKIPYNLS